MNKKNCYIIYGNHYEGLKSISDLSENIIDSFGCLDIFSSIEVSKDIVPNSFNIIIEEFSSESFCIKLENIKKKYPKTILFLIITEIPINGSFNNFKNKEFKKIIKSNTFYNYKNIYYIYLLKWKLIKAFEYVFFILKINGYLKNKLEIIKFNISLSGIYDFIRFLNTKILISKNIFDYYFIINKSSALLTSNELGVEATEFPYQIIMGDTSEKSRDNTIIFSGTSTPERVEIFSTLENLGIEVKLNTTFNNGARDLLHKTSYFSLHIPRYRSIQEYSSPTRTLKALKNGAIPISYDECLESKMEQLLNIKPLCILLKESKGKNLKFTLESYYFEKIVDLSKLINNFNHQSRNELLNIVHKFY